MPGFRIRQRLILIGFREIADSLSASDKSGVDDDCSYKAQIQQGADRMRNGEGLVQCGHFGGDLLKRAARMTDNVLAT